MCIRVCRTLDLASNKFTGPLPADVNKMTSLSLFAVQYNQFSGTIPATFGQLTNLKCVSACVNARIFV